MMEPKAHGSCLAPVQKNLRWGCDAATADMICCFNRHGAEYAGYWETTTFLAVRPFPHMLHRHGGDQHERR
jgi:hypothetical protein